MIQRIKYPRTYHLPFSLGIQSDDKLLKNFTSLDGKEVVATLKMDGENTTLYHDNYMHARSIDSKTNWTRDIAKKIHSVIQHDIPEGWRLCCENLYAKHAIHYPDDYLEGYLYLLSIWNEKNECLSFDDTVEFSQLLDLPMPKVLYRGKFDLNLLEKLSKNLDTSVEEGFVVRTTDKFQYKDFSNNVTKYVRKNHVQDNSEHWLKNAKPNGIPKYPIKPYFLNSNVKKIKI